VHVYFCACSRSKYRLQTIVRTNMAADEASYNCVVEMEDSEGHRGVKLSKDLMVIAGEYLCCSSRQEQAVILSCCRSLFGPSRQTSCLANHCHLGCWHMSWMWSCVEDDDTCVEDGDTCVEGDHTCNQRAWCLLSCSQARH
jgi:hypothetical protein